MWFLWIPHLDLVSNFVQYFEMWDKKDRHPPPWAVFTDVYSISTNSVFQYVQNMSSNGNLKMYISITSFLYSRFSKILLKYTYSSALSIPDKGKKESNIFIFQWNKLKEKYLPISCKGSSEDGRLLTHTLLPSTGMFFAYQNIITMCCFPQGYLNVNPPVLVCLLFTMFSSLYTEGLLETSWTPLLGSSFLYKKAISVPLPTFSSEFYLLQEGELNKNILYLQFCKCYPHWVGRHHQHRSWILNCDFRRAQSPLTLF